MKSTSGKMFRARQFTSLTVTVGFLLMLLSGILLFLAPKGRIAHAEDWKLLGLAKEQWSALHLTASVLFLVSAVAHTVFNWRPLVRYLSTRKGPRVPMSGELVAAVLVGILFVVGTLKEWPPFSSLVSLREDIKHGGEAGGHGGGGRGGRGGGGGEDGCESDEASEEGSNQHGGQDGKRGRGAGRMTLAELCRQEKLSLEEAVGRLDSLGIQADGATRLRDIAEQHGVRPHDVLPLLQED